MRVMRNRGHRTYRCAGRPRRGAYVYLLLLGSVRVYLSQLLSLLFCSFFFFFNDTATTEIYTLSLHDALPISPARLGPAAPGILRRSDPRRRWHPGRDRRRVQAGHRHRLRRYLGLSCRGSLRDRKSTRLNSSHANISYAVFCLKKKKNSRPQQSPYEMEDCHLRRQHMTHRSADRVAPAACDAAREGDHACACVQRVSHMVIASL